MPRSRRLCLRTGVTAVLVAIAGLAAGASAADAGPLVASAPWCDGQSVSNPFAPWLDPADYTPLAGGDFEGDGAGWWTNGPAAIADGNESFHVGGADDSKSLELQSGSSAGSPSICVGIEHPTIRFFVKRRSVGPLAADATLRVDAFVELADGAVVPVTIAHLTGFASWQPTVIVGSLLPLLPGEHTPVAFRFTAQTGDWSIDDVEVDPYGRR